MPSTAPIFCNCANNINGLCYGGKGATAYVDTVARAHNTDGSPFLPKDCPGYKTPDQAPDKSSQAGIDIGPND